MSQFARPISDDVSGGWTPSTGGNSWSLLDEAIADDSDYISEAGLGTSPETSNRLASLTDPVSSSGHIIHARLKTGTGAGSITVLLYEGGNSSGGTLRATATFNSLSSSFADYTYTLSGAEADSITDYTNLHFEYQSSLGKGNTAYISQTYFEVPDAVAAVGLIPMRKPVRRTDVDLAIILEEIR